MRAFLTIWIGQLISTLGSAMTVFALTLWVWQQTESATALALFSVFNQLPRLGLTLFAGVLVDRANRQRLMLWGDVSAAIATAVVGLLWWTGHLQIWHLWVAVAVHGGFGQVQQLAYSASIALMVPPDHYTRAGSLRTALGFGAAIVSPALAGSLYPRLGLGGIVLIDLATFVAAFGTLLAVQIPQPPPAASSEPIGRQLTAGFRYIRARSGLTAMVVIFTLFAIPSDMGRSLLSPMILARTNGSAQALGAVTAAAGLGGLAGAVGVALWGGFQRRIDSLLLGFVGTGAGKLAVALGQNLGVWLPGQFCAHLPLPLVFSAYSAIWYAKVPSTLQGQVLAADELVGLGVGAIAPLVAGLLADRIFEPALQPGGSLVPFFGPLMGTGSGAGIALLYGITAIWMGLTGVVGYSIAALSTVET